MATPARPTKQQRTDERRAAAVAEIRREQARRARTRAIGIVAAIVGAVAVIAIVVTVIVLTVAPSEPEPGPIAGDYEDRLQVYPNLESAHTEASVVYDQTPPVGGSHNPAWLNCGVYSQPQTDEFAVHSLEHGAIWITYDPATDADTVDALVGITPSTYAILSPYPGLGAEMAISAWGAQLVFSDPDDPAVARFVEDYWRSADSPEPNAPCTGAIDGPGKVA